MICSGVGGGEGRPLWLLAMRPPCLPIPYVICLNFLLSYLDPNKPQIFQVENLLVSRLQDAMSEDKNSACISLNMSV